MRVRGFAQVKGRLTKNAQADAAMTPARVLALRE
jgi:hypothetical protein